MTHTKLITRKIFLVGMLFLLIVVFYQLLAPHVSYAGLGAASDAKNGLKQTNTTLSNTAESDLGSIVVPVINILSTIVGALSVIMVIVGGFRYVVSAGDPTRAKSARSTIIYALVGISVVVFAQTIVKYVVNKIIV